jgi:hypothetical protein
MRPRSWFLVVASLCFGVACANQAQRWTSRDQPTVEDARILLEGHPLDVVARELRPTDIAGIPIRKRLRPCCAFGIGLKVRVGAVPVPGFRIGNLMDADELGPHTYDSGALTRSSDRDDARRGMRENNGLVYTCRGGFIDTAHVRDYVDWTLYLGTQIGRNIYQGTEIALPDEGGQRRVVVKPVDRELIDRYGRTRVTIQLAHWIGFQLSIWHEIATWYGWSWVRTFPETASAFSPEDLYSNALGSSIVTAIALRRFTRTEHLFNRSVDDWNARVLEVLGAVPKSVGEDAMRAVDQLWWDSSRRLPDKELTLRRNLDISDPITPWLVPEDRAPDSLREACGDAPQPLSISTRDSVLKVRFADWVTLEIDVDDNLAAQEPFTEIGRKITQNDYPRIIEAIREQNRGEFGPDADQPD